MNSPDNERPSALALHTLAAWRDAERFQAMTVPQPKRQADQKKLETYGVLDDSVMVWPEQPERAQNTPHTLITRVFVGCVPQREVDERLHKMFTAEGRFKQTRLAPKWALTPIAYFDVDESGQPIEDSLAVSALTEFTFTLWQKTAGAVPDRSSLQGALDYVDRRTEQLTETFTRVTAQDGEPLAPLALTRKLVAGLIGPSAALLSWTTAAGQQRSAQTVYHGIWVRAGQDREPDLLSSFFRADIDNALTARTHPPTLRAYLNGVNALGKPDAEGRVDMALRHNRERLLDPPDQTGAAWPSGYPLRLSQQLAVSGIVNHAGQVPVLSVNGPPGTGKTTLLRDLYATLVVQRARLLAKFKDPQQAVSDPIETFTRAGAKEIRLWVSKLDESLTGFEMVVASSNNAAVENVSAALPGLSALAAPWRAGAGYFRGPAQLVATKWAALPPDQHGQPKRRVEPWGLTAAILGKQAHLRVFADGIGLFEAGGTTGTGSLREVLSAGVARNEWSEARTAFTQASDRVKSAVEARQQAARRVRELDGLRADVAALRASVAELRDRRSEVAMTARQTAEWAAAARQADVAATAAVQQSEAHRPGWWARLRRASGVPEWDRQDADARAAASIATANFAHAQEAADTARERLHLVSASIDTGSARLRELEAELTGAAQACEVDAARFPALLTDRWWDRDDDELELRSAWVDAELQQLREHLFLAAMTVHETFTRSLEEKTVTALRAWKALVLGELRPADRAAVALRVWQWLFLVVPLVSTTFASLGRMLKDIDQPSLGWVIVDEAGQATPQSAVGAMLRFRRAVIVGDPEQLEPVVTLPDELLDRVTEHRGAPPQSSPSRCSVQLLADAANPYGTVRRGRWVGLPLRVHNRCLEPIFTIANEMAYAGKMVQGRLPADVAAPMGPSRWIDVPLASRSHWSDQADQAVRVLLRQLQPIAADPMQFPSVALLSPFVAVVDELHRLRALFLKSLGLNPHLLGNEGQKQAVRVLGPLWEGVDDSPADRLVAGTVHTFQGQEKDAVILVLGGGSEGSRGWVAGTPNLLNVAITRARDRLYVIGDWDAWDVGYAAVMHNPTLLPRCPSDP